MESGIGQIAEMKEELSVHVPVFHPCSTFQDEDPNNVFTFVSKHWLKSRSLPASPLVYRETDDQSSQESEAESIDELNGRGVFDKFHRLIERMNRQAEKVRRHIVRPATPSSTNSPTHSVSSRISIEPVSDDEDGHCCSSGTLDPQSRWSVFWMLLVSLCYVYNACGIFLRAAFPYQTPDNLYLWLCADYAADAIYLLDMSLFKPHLRVLHQGLWITEPKQTRALYFKSAVFLRDLLSLLPLDLLYFRYGVCPLLRLPRLLKLESFWEFFERLDRMASSPFIVRIIHTITYMLYLVHLNACAYYAYSRYQGIGRPDNMWIYNGEGNAYIRCFFFSTKIATSIGKNPVPTQEGEWLFMIGSWLSGVFVFATLIGQIRDILWVAGADEEHYRRMVDRTLTYINDRELPNSVRVRTRTWFAYNKRLHGYLDENKVIRCLPLELEMDVAKSVHCDVLSRVELFKDFDGNLLRELLLKLKANLYLSGDYVCRKGEVGQTMYIVHYGHLLLEKANQQTTMLTAGSVFGNRCKVDVRSRGFSNVFTLTKQDLLACIRHYPHSQRLLNVRASRFIRSAIVHGKPGEPDTKPNSRSAYKPPKLLDTVQKLLSPDSHFLSYTRSRDRGLPRLVVSAPNNQS